MSDILSYISLGELVDKLTILSIKKENIKDENKLIEINKEYDVLYNLIKHNIDTEHYLYKLLKKINEDIWISMDKIRMIDENTNTLEWVQECKKTIIDNDRRFRVKNKINNLYNSSIKEQKGYKPSKLLLITHNELGDMINHCGMIRYYSTIYDEVKVVCRNDYQKQLEYMFEDDKTITFYPKPKYKYDNSDILTPQETENISKDYIIKRLGNHIKEPTNTYYFHTLFLPFNFYHNANIPYNIFWDYYYFRQTSESNRLYNILKNNNIISYVFIHTSAANCMIFDINYIKNKLNIDKDNILIINSDYNIYDKNHIFYNIANEFVMKNILDYYTTIQNATYVILTDSCIFCLALHIPIKSENCYYVNNRHGQLYSSYLWNEKFGFNDKLGINKFKML